MASRTIARAARRQRWAPRVAWLIVGLVVSLVLCQPTGSVAAQREPPPIQPPSLIPTFQVLGRDQGLAHPTVRSILRDRRGFMWFGTNAGLNRYDGYRLTGFAASDTPSGPGVVIVSALAEDHDGVVWVGTVGAGLFMYDPRTSHFTPVQVDSPGAASSGQFEIRSLLVDRGGAS